ncbi:MAG: hypothetical protein LBT49_05990 [Prevotellaceae bacterium]|jgi:hypothetical protein|nr:hypothetical protein [Prevotellaceae bacterium]
MDPHQFLQYLSTAPPVSESELQQLEQFANRYPWCGIAHQLLLEAYYLNNNSEKVSGYTAIAAVYAVTRHYLYHRLQQIKPQETAPQEPKPELKVSPPAPAKKATTAVPSGEYFSSSDLSLAEAGGDAIGRFIIEKPKISPLSSSLAGVEDLPPVNIKAGSYALEDMVTETLAKIYADQGLHTRAIDIYETLSLREPKKSAYFADLIQTLKNAKSKF